MRLLDRLRRALPGERVYVREAAGVTVKRPRRVAEPSPNAPQLMRIVKHPYPLHPGKPSRRLALRVKEEPVESVDRLALLREALEARRPVRSTSAARGRPRPFALRPSRWIHLPDDTR